MEKGKQLQSELKQLIAKKDQVQQRIQQIAEQIERINSSKGYQKGLVDSEGFPRADLDFGDLSKYKNLKRQKAELNNDHVALMKQIQKKLFALHATFLKQENHVSETLVQHTPKQKPIKKQIINLNEQSIKKQEYKIQYLTPFAIISKVQENSPAYIDGIRQNDLLSQFSQVHIYTMNAIKEIPRFVREGIEIKIVVLRPTQQTGENIFQLKDKKLYKKITCLVTPRKWQGRGLLGCKIDPLI